MAGATVLSTSSPGSPTASVVRGGALRRNGDIIIRVLFFFFAHVRPSLLWFRSVKTQDCNAILCFSQMTGHRFLQFSSSEKRVRLPGKKDNLCFGALYKCVRRCILLFKIQSKQDQRHSGERIVPWLAKETGGLSMKKLRISVTGCSLADFLYANVDFSSPAFRSCASVKDGDGGLQPGKLVFADALEKFVGKPYAEIRKGLTGGRKPPVKTSAARPSSAAINAAQILSDLPVEFRFLRGHRQRFRRGIHPVRH